MGRDVGRSVWHIYRCGLFSTIRMHSGNNQKWYQSGIYGIYHSPRERTVAVFTIDIHTHAVVPFDPRCRIGMCALMQPQVVLTALVAPAARSATALLVESEPGSIV